MSTINEISNKNNRKSWWNGIKQELLVDYLYNNLPENFEAIVLSGEPEQHNSAEELQSFGKEFEESNDNRFYFVRVMPIKIQGAILPNPFLAKTLDVAKRLINAYPLAYIEVNNSVHPPTHGDVYQCRYTNNDQRGIALVERLRNSGQKIGKISNREIHKAFRGVGSGGTIGGGSPNYGPSGDMTPSSGRLQSSSNGYRFGGDHALEKIEAKITASSTLVVGIGSELAAKQAQEEITWWLGRKEQDAGLSGNNDKNHPVFKKIQKYHHYVSKKDRPYSEYETTFLTDGRVAKEGISGDASKGYGDSKTGIEHWSATSVSWAMRGTGFPRYYGHTYYSSNIQGGRSPGWAAHSLIRERVKIQVGDVLVKTGNHGKGKSRLTAAHGDIVYKIENNVAHLSGGNLGSRGTFKEAARIPLDGDGVGTATGNYIVILKKVS